MHSLTADFFTNNRQKLVQAIGKKGIIVVPGNGLMQRSADTSFAFRQDSNLYYLTGITEPCAMLVIDTIRNEEWIMLPLRDGVKATFDGNIDSNKLMAVSGISSILSEKEGWKKLRQLAASAFYAPQKPASRLHDMYTNPHRTLVLTKLQRIANEKIVDIRSQLAALRMIKSEAEILVIEQAANITYQTLKMVTDNLKNYQSERDIEADISKQFLLGGASGHSYLPIVASGVNSCTLHYSNNNSSLLNNDILLFDIGAEVSQYASDISRTCVIGGKPSRRQQDVMQAVADAQAVIIDFIKPGHTFKQLSQFADITIANKLIDLGLLSKNYSPDNLHQYYPHAITHFLGLDGHDVGDYSSPLQNGMVITIEPGIYIAKENIGVRIEDDFVITKNGAKIIGKSLPPLL